jgi:hypothetical protein
MFRPSVLIARLLTAATAAVAILVGVSSQAQALRPDPGGAPVPGSRVPEPASSAWSAPTLWIAVAVAVLTLALAAAVVMRSRRRPLLRRSQPSPTA